MSNETIPNFDQYFADGAKTTVVCDDKTYDLTFRTMYAGKVKIDGSPYLSIQNLSFPKEGLEASECIIDFALAEHETLRKFRPLETKPEVVAFARIICLDTKPVEWRLAEGFDPKNPSQSINTIDVVGGMIQIAEPQYVKDVGDIYAAHPEIKTFKDFIDVCLDPKTNPTIQFETLLETGFSTWRKINNSVAIDIEAGLGGEIYSIYAGHDALGRVCRLVCDFGLLSPSTWNKHIV